MKTFCLNAGRCEEINCIQLGKYVLRKKKLSCLTLGQAVVSCKFCSTCTIKLNQLYLALLTNLLNLKVLSEWFKSKILNSKCWCKSEKISNMPNSLSCQVDKHILTSCSHCSKDSWLMSAQLIQTFINARFLSA